MSLHTTFTNGRVAITKQFIIGLCVMTESGWYRIKDCTVTDIEMILDLIDFNPTCPFTKEIQDILAEKKGMLLKA